MADPLRQQILEALVTRLEAIDGSNNYRTAVAKVEVGAKGPDEVGPGLRPFIGIEPGEETIRDTVTRVESAWRIDIYCYLSPNAQDGVGVGYAINELAQDIRRALYGTDGGALGLGDVWMTIERRRDSVGDPQSVTDNLAWLELGIVVNFEEEFTAT